MIINIYIIYSKYSYYHPKIKRFDHVVTNQENILQLFNDHKKDYCLFNNLFEFKDLNNEQSFFCEFLYFIDEILLKNKNCENKIKTFFTLKLNDSTPNLLKDFIHYYFGKFDDIFDDLPIDFNSRKYRNNYQDLIKMNHINACLHYKLHGKKEGRTYL
jgi:hypothetical protein